MRTGRPIFSALVNADAPAEIGFFTWDISDNILYADGALAGLFGLDAAEAANGLPIEVYLQRVHPDDRPRLARTIRDSIVADRPQYETYRVQDEQGEYSFVTGYGRGFRSRNGDTIRYAGVVVPADRGVPIDKVH